MLVGRRERERVTRLASRNSAFVKASPVPLQGVEGHHIKATAHAQIGTWCELRVALVYAYRFRGETKLQSLM